MGVTPLICHVSSTLLLEGRCLCSVVGAGQSVNVTFRSGYGGSMPEATTRRGPRSKAVILQAALDLCRERTYAHVTMEGIAARAGVGKPTLYRWWPSKGAVVLDALYEQVVTRWLARPYSGDATQDLHNWIRRLAGMFADPRTGPMLAGLVGAAQHDAALAAALRERIYLPTRLRNQECIRAAQAAGALPAIDPEMLEDLLISPLWFRLMVSREPLTPEYAAAVVEAVLRSAPEELAAELAVPAGS